MTEPMSTPDSGGLREWLGLDKHEVAMRDMWRDLAEKNIEMGTDWPFIARTLYRDIDRLLAAHPDPVPAPDSEGGETACAEALAHYLTMKVGKAQVPIGTRVTVRSFKGAVGTVVGPDGYPRGSALAVKMDAPYPKGFRDGYACVGVDEVTVIEP